MHFKYLSNIIITILFSLLIVLTGCNDGTQKMETNKPQIRAHSVHKTRSEVKEATTEQLASFVISCGSGCAMTYTPESVTGKLPVLKVKFKVEMFVDEKSTDTYNEAYEFSFEHSDHLNKVNFEGKSENVLETLPENAQRSFREFANQLVNKKAT